jgi:hypothetical protein
MEANEFFPNLSLLLRILYHRNDMKPMHNKHATNNAAAIGIPMRFTFCSNWASLVSLVSVGCGDCCSIDVVVCSSIDETYIDETYVISVMVEVETAWIGSVDSKFGSSSVIVATILIDTISSFRRSHRSFTRSTKYH